MYVRAAGGAERSQLHMFENPLVCYRETQEISAGATESFKSQGYVVAKRGVVCEVCEVAGCNFHRV